MITHNFNIKHKLGIILVFLALVFPSEVLAQRMGHGASRGGGRSISRPSTPRATPSRSINGGHKATNNRSFSKPKTSTNRATTQPNMTRNKKTTNLPSTNNTKTRKTSTVRNKTTNNIGNNNKVGNKTHIGNNNVNINVNNSRHTRVRASSRRYTRPPYRYGGRGYYCHRPYYYHPYRPFYWGSYYHPWGYFTATIVTTAVIVAIVNDNDDKEEYHYDNGTYYLKTPEGFVAVQAPVGAQVESIPKEAEKVEVNETNNYYYGGAFYEKNPEGYIVVPATAGTIVPHLPEGGEEVKIGDQTYVQFGETYYQPIQLDGKDMYEIVEIKEE